MTLHVAYYLGPKDLGSRFDCYAAPMTIRTRFAPVILLKSSFISSKRVKSAKRIYRNPVIYAQELRNEIEALGAHWERKMFTERAMR